MAADDRQVLGELTTLASDLLEEATAVRHQWVALGEALGLEVEAAADAAEPAAAEEHDPVRLVALDMVLSGRSREEIETYLRQTFGDGYRPEVVDELLAEYR